MLGYTKPLIATVSVLTLAACGGSDRATFSAWNQQAGSFLDEGAFGNPTMNNIQIHNGEKTVLSNLNSRFSAEVVTTVNFPFNSAQLDGAAQQTLRQQANWIKQFPEVRFRVYGHTDLVGSSTYNKNLGLRRANAVVSFLASQGISPSRLEAKVSFGESQPVVYTEQPERRNRRTVTEVTGFVQGNPMLLNGKYAEVIQREYIASATELPPESADSLK